MKNIYLRILLGACIGGAVGYLSDWKGVIAFFVGMIWATILWIWTMNN